MPLVLLLGADVLLALVDGVAAVERRLGGDHDMRVCRLEGVRPNEGGEGERKHPNLRCHFSFVFFDSLLLKLEK